MAKQDQKAKQLKIEEKQKKVGFGSLRRGVIGKARLLWWMVWTDIKRKVGNFDPEPEGVRIGASVKDAAISINLVMKNGSEVTVVMNVEGARQIQEELDKAIDMVRFKGKR